MKIGKILVWLGRRLALAVIFLIMFIAVQSVWPLHLKASSASPMLLLRMLFVMCIFYSFAIAALAYRSQGTVIKRVTGLAVFIFGVASVQAVVESLFFRASVEIPIAQQYQMLGMGFIRAVLFALAAVLLIPAGKEVITEDIGWKHRSVGGWTIRLGVLSIVFPIIYYFCGFIIAWQNPAVREYYQNGSQISILPLFSFQIFRGLIWCGLAILALRTTQGRKVERTLVIGLAMGILHGIQLIIPSAYMPDTVRYTHLVELLVSISVFGVLSSWCLWGKTSSSVNEISNINSNV